MKVTHLRQVAQHVEDMDRAVAFYRDVVGLDLIARFDPPGQLSALSVLVFGGERTIAQLAEAEQVTSPTMTRIVDGLEQASLAERHPHPQDGRATLVRATKKGRRIMERGRQRRVDLITDLLEPLSEGEMRALGRAVDALAKALEAESA